MTSRIAMLVAAGFLAAGSVNAAQGRGQGGPPPGRGGQGNVARGPVATGAPKSPGGGRGGAPTSPGAGRVGGDAGKGRSGGAPGHVGDGGNANAGSGRGRGGAPKTPEDGRGNAGGPPTSDEGGRGRGNAGGVGRGGDTGGDDENATGGRGRGNQNAENDGSWVDRLNPNLRARLETMLPDGMSLGEAASGFRNQGQFIAALEQANNHNISFSDLKSAMTGDDQLSLGQALRKLGVATDED